MSNVDLAQTFTNMITAQRGFQANSRVISTADEMLAGPGEPEALVASRVSSEGPASAGPFAFNCRRIAADDQARTLRTSRPIISDVIRLHRLRARGRAFHLNPDLILTVEATRTPS